MAILPVCLFFKKIQKGGSCRYKGLGGGLQHLVECLVKALSQRSSHRVWYIHTTRVRSRQGAVAHQVTLSMSCTASELAVMSFTGPTICCLHVAGSLQIYKLEGLRV